MSLIFYGEVCERRQVRPLHGHGEPLPDRRQEQRENIIIVYIND